MVQEPSFLTLALEAVRRLRSRSVAVRESLSPDASKRELERMGIVVLRSMTPWVAVSSLRSSNLLTVISMVPVAVATSTGITESPVRTGATGVPWLYQNKKLENQQ